MDERTRDGKGGERMAVNWKGEEVKGKMERATIFAINETVKDTIVHALNNHPGWKNVNYLAEGSITQKEFAKKAGRWTTALWGSVWPPGQGTNYVWFLEYNHGSFLRRAADAISPTVIDRIKKALKSL